LPPWRVVAHRLRRLSTVEQIVLAACLASAAILRFIAVFRYQIDSDEPQHLHVVWGWTHGLLQYRDVFDNHMPLFHMLCAPLLLIVGERPDALIMMRALMVPLYAAMIFLTYRIAASCYPRRVAMWSAVIAALIPGFLLCSVEFRTDDLWALFWLLTIALLVRPPLTNARIAAAGFILGLAFAVSAKTTLLLLSLAVGGFTLICVGAGTRGLRARLNTGLMFLAAFAIPPLAVALFFAAQGAWEPFFYGTITHNIVPHVKTPRLLAFPCLLALIGLFARKISDRRQLFLFVTTHFYAAAMFCLWPIVEREHWLPYYPLAAVTLVPFLMRSDRVSRKVIALALMEIVLVVWMGGLWRNQTRYAIRIIDQTLRLTMPGERVMDLKGEMVFRRRTFFYVLEPLTKYRIHKGDIANTIVSDILRTRTMVVAHDHPGFPRRTRAFLLRNFIPVGAVRVPGLFLRPKSTTFRVQVPAEYAIVGEHDPFRGLLDGRPYDAPRFLAAGMHTIEPARRDRYALIWSRAAAMRFSPFGVPDPRPHWRNRFFCAIMR
jgi:hypothetical protein